jgi:hypothetical protein
MKIHKIQKTPKKISLLASEPTSIRITFEYRFLNEEWEYPTCKEEDQIVSNFD